MEEEYVTINIKYGIGYGSHKTDMVIPANATDDEINVMVFDAITEWLDYTWERAA